MKIPFVFDDGGRSNAGYKGKAGDCVARAIAITTKLPYANVYKDLATFAGNERNSKGKSARNGIHTSRKWFKDYMKKLGFVWTPTMKIGQGCKIHLVAEEVPIHGIHILTLSKHVVALMDGTLYDIYDPQREVHSIYTIPENQEPKPNWKFLQKIGSSNQYAAIERRCVYGYWTLKG